MDNKEMGWKHVHWDKSTSVSDEPRWIWPQLDVECRSTACRKSPLLSDRLPESSAKGFKRQLSKFQRGATWINWSHCVLLQWMAQWVSAARRVVPTRLCGSWKKAFQKTWPYCRNGHHFTVQHLRFSVEESASPALLETVSGGLLWSVKPER